jgi:SSS family solute:Na+ symporter
MFNNTNTLIIGIVFIYLAFMLGIGIYSSKKSIKNTEDYLVAGRRLPWWLLIGTLAATEIGAGSTMGVAEKAYGEWGLSSIWYIWTMAISFLILAIVAPKLRGSEVMTVPEFFKNRYGKFNHILTSVIMFLPLIGLTAVQMIATATIFSTITGIDYTTSALISCGIIVIYTVLGGMWSVSLTDFWQFILIVAGMGITLPFIIIKTGGIDTMFSHIPAEKLSLFQGMGFSGIISLIIIYVTSWLIGQEVTQRLYSAKDKKNVILGTSMTSVFYLFFAFIPPFIGLSIYALVSEGIVSADLLSTSNAQNILPIIAIEVLPPVIVGFLFAGLISATMSSASSDLLGASSILTNDIWFSYLSKETCEDKKKITIIRLLVAFIGIISLGIAILKPSSIINLLMFSFSLRAAGSFFPYLLGHYTNKITSLSTTLSLIIPTLLLIFLELTHIKILNTQPLIPALTLSLIIIIVVSFLQHIRTKPL